MDSLSSDLVLKIIQYLNAVDSGRLEVSQRYYYLVHQYRRLRGPELVTTFQSSQFPPDHDNVETMMGQMVENCKQKIQSKPNLVLYFSTPGASDSLAKKLSSLFGNDSSNETTVVLGAVSPNEIQVYQPKNTVEETSSSMGGEPLTTETCASLMAMNFPGATILPFCMRGSTNNNTPNAINLDFLKGRLNFHNKNRDDDNFWKATILYATGSSSDEVVTGVQALMPNAAIIGGVCEEGHVSFPRFSNEELRSMSIKHLRYLSRMYAKKGASQTVTSIVEKQDLVDHVAKLLDSACQDKSKLETVGFESFFGVVLGGDIPVRSVVSRGVYSILNDNGPPRSFSNLIVDEVEFFKAGEDSFFFGENGPPVHMIRTIKEKNTNRTYSPMQVIEKYLASSPHMAQFMGLKRIGHDGFEMSHMNNLVEQINMFVVVTDGSEASEESLKGAELDFFTLNGKACMEDMDRTMVKLSEQTKGEEILGALMYTCCGRGPKPGLIPERMSDATRFANVFPNVPCLGFYANGEFGPLALAGNEDVFQVGRSTHQGVS